jgi:hypothetical protein
VRNGLCGLAETRSGGNLRFACRNLKGPIRAGAIVRLIADALWARPPPVVGVAMMETREAPCSNGTFAAYQEVLLQLNPSNIDDIVAKFNEDSVWADPYFVAQVVTMVAGSRKNGAELIDS